MWVVEEYRQGYWCRISQPLDNVEAQQALRILRFDRPWRPYRLVAFR
jgi:hypothetical protein